MDRAISALTAGLLSELKKLDITSNNLANVNTPGFKRDETFSDWMSVYLLNARTAADPAARDALRFAWLLVNRDQDGTLVRAAPILDAGTFQHTGNPLDVAIQGDGFFVLKKGNQEVYTRRGRFQLDPQGNLLSVDGYSVMGVNGPIRIPRPGGTRPYKIRIEEDGSLFNGTQRVARLKLVRFPKGERAVKVGNTNFRLNPGAKPQDAGPGVKVRQGYLELSNTNVVKEMTDMITETRSFEAYQKMIQTLDDLKGRLIQGLSR